ncbi:MAG TPA: GntR family transcriptional regulator [Vicinamibacterales bacterium]
MPLYHQVEQVIRHRIATGTYPPDAKIPSEYQLGEELEVSRITIREAVGELVADGLLVRVQGKGTFVTPNLASSPPPIKYNGFIEAIYDHALSLNTTHADIKRVPATQALRDVLLLRPGTKEMIRIERTRHHGNEPYSFLVNYLPLTIGSRIDVARLRDVPLMTIIERDLQIPIISASETVEATGADPEVAEHLQVPVLHPVMHITRVMFTEQQKPIEVVEVYYRADKYQYRVNLTRVDRDGHASWSAHSDRGPGSSAR